MRKERTSLYIAEGQQKHLAKRSREEDLPIADGIRRAFNAYLAWDDPTYQSHPSYQSRNGHLSAH